MNKKNYGYKEQENYIESTEPISTTATFIENNPSSNKKQSAIVIVYQDENGEKYLDAETIATLVQANYYEYDYPQEQQFIVSAEILRTKGASVAPDGFTSVKRVLPDFSSVLPHDEEFNLYKVITEQLNELISNFEKNNPQIFVQIEKKPIVHGLNYKNDYSEKADSIKYNNQDKIGNALKNIVNAYQNNKDNLLKDDEKTTKKR